MGSFMEDMSHILPALEEGVNSLGDLWNCRNSTFLPNINLFKVLESKFIYTVPKQNLVYTFKQVQTTKDSSLSLKIGVNLTVEALFGLIKCTIADGELEHKITKHFFEEQFELDYELETYTLKTRPCARYFLDDDVKRRILNGQLKCTHFVSEMSLGCQIKAKIRLTDKELKKMDKLSGNAIGKGILVPVGEILKASVALITADEGGNSKEKTIELKFNPKTLKLKQPESIVEMIGQFETIQEILQNTQKDYRHLNEILVGVPISYRIVPISQIIDVSISRVYRCIESHMGDLLLNILSAIQNYQNDNYIKRWVCEQDPSLRCILKDDLNPWTMAITTRELKLRNESLDFKIRSAKIMKNYKESEGSLKEKSQELQSIVEDFHKKFSQNVLIQEFELFLTKGQALLESVCFHIVKQADKKILKIFKNSQNLITWRDGGDSYTRLEINCKDHIFPQDFFQKLTRISAQIKEKGVDKFQIGLTLSNIFENEPKLESNFKIKLEVGEKDLTFEMEEMDHVFASISIALGIKNESNSKKFYAVLENMKISQNSDINKNLLDIPNMISILKLPVPIKICESNVELFETILVGKSEKFQFLMPLSSNFQIFENYFHLAKAISTIGKVEIFEKIDWIVGDFEIDIKNEFEIPTLMIFKNGQLIGGCFDKMEILILQDILESAGENLEILENLEMTRVRNLHPLMGEYTLKICKLFQIDYKNHEIQDMKIDEKVLNFVKLCKSTKNMDLISQSAAICLEKFSKISHTLCKNGWNFNKFPEKTEENWESQFLRDLDHYISQQSEYNRYINGGIVILEEIIQNKYEGKYPLKIISHIIQMKNPKFPKKLKLKIEALQDSNNKYHKIDQTLNILKKYYNSESIVKNDNLFEIDFLSQCVQSNKDGNFSKISLLSKYFEKLFSTNLEKFDYDNIMKEISSGRMYNVHNIISKYGNSSKIFKISQEMAKLKAINGENIIKYFENIVKLELDEDLCEILWTDDCFVYLLSKYLDDEKILQVIYDGFCQNEEIPRYIPKIICDKISDFLLLKDMGDREIEDWELSDPSDIKEYLKYISVRNKIPKNLHEKMLNFENRRGLDIPHLKLEKGKEKFEKNLTIQDIHVIVKSFEKYYK